MKILFTSGGTGGHIFPIIAVVRELKKQKEFQKKKLNFFFVGPKDKFGLKLLKQEGVIVKTITAGKIRRYITPKSILENIRDIFFKMPIGLIQGFLLTKTIFPDVIFSKGGYGAVPVMFAAKILKIPIFLHESDAVPGKATQKFAREALMIFSSFDIKIPGVFQKKIVVTGNPIRKNILKGNAQKGRELFGLSDQKPVILILGGSQGATRINDLVIQTINPLLKNFEIVHQCGQKNVKEMNALSAALIEDEKLSQDYHLVGFLEEGELEHILAAAHIVISRAGAGSIFEIAAAGKPSLLMPLPEAAQNHQAINAYLYSKTSAAEIMEPQNPTPNMLYSMLMRIFSEPERLKSMGEAAKRFSKPEAAETIAEYLAEFVRQETK
jgi:UDP-N-acetylglucosamine--N-acetylmuramyl-(pentapeptide) pyrophosphoryl-undecaprenol N-acetylglucosamine transferase